MDSLRKWFYRPKKDDKSLLAQFFFADEALNMIANELDSFDGRKDPERCTSLVNQLRQSQDKVLTITNSIMDALIGDERANRDFRVKFPEDVLQENLAGQLWFGAECLAAGSSIMNRESESTAMRPLAKALTKSLENVRNLLREACLRNNTPNGPLKLNNNELVTEMLLESLKIFDRLFAEFELSYVSAMVPVKTTQEYELQELIGVLFSETLQRALKMKLLTQETVDDCDPALMFTIPRLAIVSGLLVFPNGPLCIDKPVDLMSELFKPFRTLLHKIRELLWTLNKRELYTLEKLLCDNEQGSDVNFSDCEVSDEFVSRFYTDYPICKDYASNFFTVSVNNDECEAESVYETIETKNATNTIVEEVENLHLSSDTIEIPSTSGYLIPNTVEHDSIVASITLQQNETSPVIRAESLPDHDSLQIISDAAATLTSILSTKEPETSVIIQLVQNIRKIDLESPDDSGICTENTSLDRSPSLELQDNRIICGCSNTVQFCNCSDGNTQRVFKATNYSPSTSKGKKKVLVRRKGKLDEFRHEEDSSSVGSTDTTSSFNSTCADDEEIALAMQAAEIANRKDVRSKFRSSEDLIHRLYVCIAGVSDQLQTNFASDLRNILKSVFLMNASDSENTNSESIEASMEFHPTESDITRNEEFSVDPNILAQEALFDSNVYFHLNGGTNGETIDDYTNHPRQIGDIENSLSADLNRYASLREDVTNLHDDSLPATTAQEQVIVEETMDRPPIWIPDVEAPKCMSCGSNFTVVKRRHHCRNCGKVFCARCSSNSVPLPKFGHNKPVRVCNKCFIYHLAPFTM